MRVQTDRDESILLLFCPSASEADLQEAKPWWGSKALTAGVLGCRGVGFPALLPDPVLAAQLPQPTPAAAPLAGSQPSPLARSFGEPAELCSSVSHVLTRAPQHFLHPPKT